MTPKTFFINTLFTLSIATPAILTGSLAQAASDSVCRTYADAAVTQNAANRRNNCGFAGLRWHGDGGGHFLFCKLTSESNVLAETRARDDLLDQCIGVTVDDDPLPAENNQAVDQEEPAFQREPAQVVGNDGNNGAGNVLEDAVANGNADTPNIQVLETPEIQLIPNGVEQPDLDTLVTPIPQCKARLVSRSATHESESEARRLALLDWEDIVAQTYGADFADPSAARDATLGCEDPANDQTRCTISGFPCNG